MDVQSFKPAVGTQFGRPETVQYREAVRTELPDVKAVSAAGKSSEGEGAALRDRPGRSPDEDALLVENKARLARLADQIREELQKRIVEDKAAKTMVFRTVDAESGKVVNQYPDEAMLKMRAWAREMERKEAERLADRNESDRVEKVA